MAKRKVERQQARAGAEPEAESLLGLKVFVTVAGAVLMALEIVGSRLLAPHFGNSVFVWGSLIGVFLAALALGYWRGGILADRRPSPGLLAALCVAVSALLFLIPWIGHRTCRHLVEAGLSDQSGPLVAATLLFLPPSVLLGMVSPFSVRIAARSVATIGRAAGSLYALSTVGSIAGTLLTTFVLIPTFGVTWIVRGLALIMLLLPISLMGSIRRRRGVSSGSVATALVVGVIGLLLPAHPAAVLQPGEVVVLEEDTPYHHILVTDLFDHRARALRFDQYTESAIDLRPPNPTLSEYTNYFHVAFLLRPGMERALFIGAGGGIGPRTFHETDPDLSIDVVDIDGRVLEIARDYFFMPDVPEIRTFAEDGRMFLQASAGGYDCIVLDAFTIGGRIPFHLATREAFELCHDRLLPGGVFIMNINSALEGAKGEIFQSIGRTLREVFPDVQAFASDWRRSATPAATRNILFVASRDRSGPDAAAWRELAAGFAARSSVSKAMMADMVQDLVETWPDLAAGSFLTDDHAPIETMGF